MPARAVPLRAPLLQVSCLLLLAWTPAFEGRTYVREEDGNPASTEALALAAYERVFPLHSLAVSWEAVDFEAYRHIIVSGPQRSGTTYFAKALAERLNYTWMDENNHDRQGTPLTASDGSKFVLKNKEVHNNGLKAHEIWMYNATESLVAQRPTWTSLLHELPVKADALVVFLARNCLDVFESQNKMFERPTEDRGWTCRFGRTLEWAHYKANSQLSSEVDMYAMICTIKQQAFLRVQLPIMKQKGLNVAVIGYDSLSTLEHFREKDARDGFDSKEVGFSF